MNPAGNGEWFSLHLVNWLLGLPETEVNLYCWLFLSYLYVLTYITNLISL